MENGSAIAFFAFLAFVFWLGSRRQDQATQRRYDLYRTMMEHPGPGAEAVRQLVEEEERRGRELFARSSTLGGLVVIAVGVLMTIFFHMLVPGEPVLVLGLIPLAVGIIILLTGGRGRKPEPRV